ncbi:signal peptidase I [Demequina sp. SO4-13]|uniref:signal peptidase I n=1 Tax=Demequina sp. SO4-13 TaxID=3401027 RepID=UPI003AF9AA2C
MAAMLDANTGSLTASRYWRVLRQAFAWALLAVAVYFLWPAALGGGTSLVIVSGDSMEPTYHSGDMVIARSGAPAVGDVIVYAPEGLGGAQVVHRIIGGDAESGWELRGDNNDFIDPFYPAEAEVRGVVQVHIPNAGAVTMRILNPLVWCGVILAALVVALWPSEGKDEEQGDDEPEPESDPEDEDESDGSAPDSEDSVAPAGAVALARVAAKPASRRRHQRVALAALAGGLSLLAVACATPASAAQLTLLVGHELAVLPLQACAPGQAGGAPVIDSTGTDGTSAGVFSEVSLSGVPAACHGRPLEVFVHDSSGTVISSGSETASASPIIAMSGYAATSVATVVVRIGGWIFPTTWTAPLPPVPTEPYSCVGATSAPQGTGEACTVTPKRGNTWGSPGSRLGHQTFSVDTSAPNAIVTIDLSKSPFPGWTVAAVMTNGDWIKVPGYSCSELPLVRVYANPANGGKKQGAYFWYQESAAGIGSQNVICPGP